MGIFIMSSFSYKKSLYTETGQNLSYEAFSSKGCEVHSVHAHHKAGFGS